MALSIHFCSFNPVLQENCFWERFFADKMPVIPSKTGKFIMRSTLVKYNMPRLNLYYEKACWSIRIFENK